MDLIGTVALLLAGQTGDLHKIEVNLDSFPINFKKKDKLKIFRSKFFMKSLYNLLELVTTNLANTNSFKNARITYGIILSIENLKNNETFWNTGPSIYYIFVAIFNLNLLHDMIQKLSVEENKDLAVFLLKNI